MKKLIFYAAILLCLLPGCFFVSVPFTFGPEPLREKVVTGKGKNKILLLDISGIISEQKKRGLLKSEKSMVARIKEQLEKASGDPRVTAVVLKINSPGGTVTASDILYREFNEFKRKTGKKVIVSLMDIAASGGYYIALSGDRIIAHPTTITGSIGVIILKLNLKGLMEKIGIKDETIKTGDKKDIFSPFKPLKPDEKEILRKLTRELFNQFVKIVERERKLDPEQLKKISDGRAFSAQEALDLKLIDQIGYLDEAIETAKKESGIKEAKVIIYSSAPGYGATIYSNSFNSSRPNYLNFINLDLGSFIAETSPRFMYLWIP